MAEPQEPEASESELQAESKVENPAEDESEDDKDGALGKAPRRSMKEKLEDLIAEYGAVAFVIFFGIFLLTYTGFFIAIKAGIDVDSSTGKNAGSFFAAWVATKLTMPLRVLATLVLTPIVARVVRRKRRPETVNNDD